MRLRLRRIFRKLRLWMRLWFQAGNLLLRAYGPYGSYRSYRSYRISGPHRPARAGG